MSAHTLSNYQRDIDRYQEWLGEREIADVTSNDIEQHLVWLQNDEPGHKGIARSSAARALASIRSLHDFGEREKLLPSNVAVTVPVPKRGSSIPKALTVEQVSSLLDATPNDAAASLVDIRDRAVLEMLYSTGARISELLALDVDDVDQGERMVLVRGKGAKERLVPLGSPASEALEQYVVRARPAMNKKGSPALFLNMRGGRMGRQSGFKTVMQAAERAGLPPVNPHALRHSFATHLLQGGADVRVVQELLGHSSVATTQIYTKVTADHLREMWATSHPRV
ncbi:tyrosine recombinase [Corynebacterium resistens DSM 45100]|uniref:Tyrosine recombinase XerC n=1 Tax=Corynebacterium resistens (strain DSM 45100 / JCM 12819 / GTC 2026 / SICGH 158) TaxID=662755 RepID=F8E1R0_CORRG|nr:tyrosine recombinase [Corynebacterium resistens DSM 45100]